MLKQSVRTAVIWSNCYVAIPSLTPAAAFLETLSVVLTAATWVMAANWITAEWWQQTRLQVTWYDPILHPWVQNYHWGKSTRRKGTNPPPKKNMVSPSSRYSRKWHEEVVIYLNTLRYRMCSECLKVTVTVRLVLRVNSERVTVELDRGKLKQCVWRKQ